jgi:hypothetical protein
VIQTTPRFVSRLSRRARTLLAAICLGIVLGFVGIFFVGEQSTGATVPGGFLVHLYPGTWPPFARGVLWLVVGAAAVVFDLLAITWVETDRGRRGTIIVAAVTGMSFLIFASASFAGAGWSVIH